MRHTLIILFFSFVLQSVAAQSGDQVFEFLTLPSSARANALGGHTVSLVERDPSLIFHNPALLGGEMDGMINLDYMNYIADVNVEPGEQESIISITENSREWMRIISRQVTSQPVISL